MDRKDSPYSHWLRKHHLGFVVALLAIGYSHCINFILNTFFLKVKCTPHDKIAKELKEQNDGIYRTVMVSTYNISYLCFFTQPICIVQLLVGKLIANSHYLCSITGMRDYMLSS